jgi:mono/diheme cytochrome c family protein
MGWKTALAPAALAAAVVVTASAAGQIATKGVEGNPARGKVLFLQHGLYCGSCHTLKAARSTGRDGPNLDRARPSYASVVEIVTKGRDPSGRWPTGMPRYGGAHSRTTAQQIRDLAAFVYTATHR